MTARHVAAFGCSFVFHLGVVWLPWWLSSAGGAAALADTHLDRAMPVFVVPREDATYPGLNPVDSAAAARIQALDDEASRISIGGFTFDAGKLAQRATVLFPFVSPGLSLEHFGLWEAGKRPLLFERRAPAATARDGTATARPLAISDAAIQAVIDKAWSRRERWSAFEPVRLLASMYAANSGGLPTVFQRYTDQNALQPYQDMAIRDPRFWAQLGLSADHVRFIGFIRQYTSAHAGTRGAIELLFLLDRIAEASQDALATLLVYNPEEDLRWTREVNRQAYRLALQLLHYYRSELSRRGLNSPAALARHYEGVRLAILEGIVRTTPEGYRASDARFLIGTIYWRQGRRAEALRAWRDVRVEPGGSYVAANAQLADAVRSGAPVDDLDLARRINRILKNEQGRWIDLSYDRLKRFGYRFDTY